MSVIDRTRCRARQRGTAVGYRYDGCRCSGCREAHRVHTKRHREHRQPPARVRAIAIQGTGGAALSRSHSMATAGLVSTAR